MKQILLQVVKEYAQLLIPVRDYIIIALILVCSNFVFFYYVKQKQQKKIKHPLWILIFATFTGIAITRFFDVYILKAEILCNKISMAICYYQLALITKNIGLILGFDLTKYVTLTKNQNQKNKNENN